MDQITDHQPDISVTDLSSNESIDDISSTPASEGDITESEYVAYNLRFGDYYEHYADVLMYIITATEIAVLKHAGTSKAWKEEAVEKFIRYLISNDDRDSTK